VPGIRRAPTAEGLAIVLANAAERKFGFRSFVTGAPGYGKTTLMAKLARAALDTGVADLVLVHDAKDPTPQYEGVVFPTVGALVVAPPEQLARAVADGVVVIHAPESIDPPDRVAEATLTFSRNGFPTCAVIDELYDALRGPQTFAEGDVSPIPVLVRKGRSLRASEVVSTQMPQTIPSVIFDLAETRVILCTDTRSLAYLADRLKLPDAMVEAIPRLEVGEFVVSQMGREWNHVIYGPA